MPKFRPSNLSAIVGLRVREEREKRGWTLKALAARSGISYTSISELERAAATINLDHLEAFAQAFDIAPAALLPPPEAQVPSTPIVALLDAIARHDRRAMFEACGDLVETWVRQEQGGPES